MLLRRLLTLGLLALLAPATAPAAQFPTLKAAAGKHRKARQIERRVRAIETRLIGSAHAAEHARQRVLRRRAAPVATRAALTPDNGLVPPTAGGFWSPGVSLPVVAINATLMRTGRVLIFAYPWRPHKTDPETGQPLEDANEANAYVFDPVSGTSRRIDPPVDPDTGRPANIFCAGTSLLPDGRVLVVGGNVGDPTAPHNQGLDTVFTFDPATETWETHARTRQGRWYPTQTLLPDGRTIILGGLVKDGDPDDGYRINTDVELFDAATNAVDRLDSFRMNGNAGEPSSLTNPPLMGQYPHVFWMPSGRGLIAGPRKSDTWTFQAPAGETMAWAEAPDLPIHRQWAPGVLLPGSTRVMLFGGVNRDDHYSQDPQNPIVFRANGSTTVFDEANPGAGWVDGPDQKVERAFHNSVQLPDGQVALVGGGFGEDPGVTNYRWQFREAQKRVELYDPVANTFTLGNQQAEGRTYHSSALLLPDGRVMSAGDDINGPGGPDTGVRTDTAEMWSPPYLYESECKPRARPVITGMPASAPYDAPFTVTTPSTVARAVLVAPGADTHNNDMSQRVVPLGAPLQVDGGVSLRTPATADLAPPGYYMLFLLDDRGTPSVARFINLGGTDPGQAAEIAGAATPDACPPPEPEPTVTPAPTVTPPPPAKFLVRLGGPAPRLRKLLRTGRLPVRAYLSAAGTVRLRVSLGGGLVAKPRTLTYTGAVTRTANLRLTRAGKRRLARRKRATLRVRALGKPRAAGPAYTRATRRLRLR